MLFRIFRFDEEVMIRMIRYGRLARSMRRNAISPIGLLNAIAIILNAATTQPRTLTVLSDGWMLIWFILVIMPILNSIVMPRGTSVSITTAYSHILLAFQKGSPGIRENER